jgi:hypothetical protein
MVTDLSELVRARLAAKIEAGKRPSKADLEWLEATHDRAPSSSVEKGRNAKGDTQVSVKVSHRDPYMAERISDEIFDRQRARYPMSDGTVGAPIVERES